ncbi:tripartite tricarboxylate transporter substrate binding protein [Cupriavidus basilensis]|uniref:Tripartite tricarboxylate transporter substrate binding protein n=1 Tax=Cupriavidus basilensis TaxID=68895 RepID=A0ABT6AKT7_9BURK|nr:tripartite tricarboxylate transporter substrate binding protein [Cupriavidus basilensis]MDF3833222.1 tripartite tricarboxylate transporter substrate binding protein [Cupriavidus basilensis]
MIFEAKARRLVTGVRIGLRVAATAFAIAAAVGGAQSVHAQPGWTPSRPLRLVVPYAPGGGTDVLARLVVAGIGNGLGQPIVVENRPGANGVIGANVVYGSPPDGLTLLFAAADFISVAPYIHKKVVQFQPNGFRPVAPVAKMGFVLAGRPDADTKTVQDIVAKAKTNLLSYGHWGPGSMAQMGMELLKTNAHIDNMLEVPFGGAAPVMTAVMGGQIDYAFIPTPLAVANRTKLRLYALGSPERFPSIKDIPTLTEIGYTVDADTWFGVLAPPNTPQAIVDTIQAQVVRVTSQAEFRSRMADMGYTPITIDPKKFGEFVQAENQRWGAAVKAARIRIED